MDGDIVDDIYEAAFIPEKWGTVFEKFNALSGALACGFILYDETRPVRFQADELLREPLRSFVANEDWRNSKVIQHFHANPFTGFVSGANYFSPEIYDSDPAMQLARNAGLGSMLGTMIPMISGELAVIALNMPQTGEAPGADVIERLNGFHPHLARSALVAARLGLERAQVAVATLEALGLPAAVLATGGRVLASNPLLETVADVLRPAAFGRLAVVHPPADALLREAIDHVGRGHDDGVRSIPVSAREGGRAMVVHVLPLRRSAHDVFDRGDMIVTATAVTASAIVPSPTVLTGLFDLTPAEVRLASELIRGRSLKEAALAGGITYGTARTYLERIFAKTGVRQQSQLVALLGSTGVLR